MRGKSLMAADFGMGALLLGAAWFGQGCVLPLGQDCICSGVGTWKEIIIIDDQGNPVDSTAITLVRISD